MAITAAGPTVNWVGDISMTRARTARAGLAASWASWLARNSPAWGGNRREGHQGPKRSVLGPVQRAGHQPLGELLGR